MLIECSLETGESKVLIPMTDKERDALADFAVEMLGPMVFAKLRKEKLNLQEGGR